MLDPLCELLNRCRCQGMTCTLVATSPRPLVVVGWQGAWLDHEFDTAIMLLVTDLAELITGSGTCPCVRCVELERLETVLKSGCDVSPTDAVIWTDKFPSKSLEYGGDTKVMLILDMRKTKASYEEVAADIEPHQLEVLKADYPTAVISRDGTRIWLSRLPDQDRRVGSAYEIEHARWIPGDPFEALIGVLVLSRKPEETAAAVRGRCQSLYPERWQLQES
jgi:hypothetical protein